ncbi:MAG: DUF4136 domain-containing protein [Erythrobacter sp.]
MTTASSFRSLRLMLPLLLAMLLAACATPFKADVSRFSKPLPAPVGTSFAIVADNPNYAGGLEFGAYADLVAARLEEIGYTRVEDPAQANMLVRFDYGVDGGRERIRTDFVGGAGFVNPWFGPWGGIGPWGGFGPWGPVGFGRGAWGWGFADPFLGAPDVRSYTIYSSAIALKIDDAATGKRLFEGNAQAVSRTNRLQELVPNLVEAMFTGFPGNSGEVVRITVRQ